MNYPDGGMWYSGKTPASSTAKPSKEAMMQQKLSIGNGERSEPPMQAKKMSRMARMKNRIKKGLFWYD